MEKQTETQNLASQIDKLHSDHTESLNQIRTLQRQRDDLDDCVKEYTQQKAEEQNFMAQERKQIQDERAKLLKDYEAFYKETILTEPAHRMLSITNEGTLSANPEVRSAHENTQRCLTKPRPDCTNIPKNLSEQFDNGDLMKKGEANELRTTSGSPESDTILQSSATRSRNAASTLSFVLRLDRFGLKTWDPVHTDIYTYIRRVD